MSSTRRKTAAPQLQMTMSQLPDPRPLPRLRKRSKRNDNDVNNNYEKDNNDDNNNDVDAVSNLISRRLHVEKLIPNKSERIQILHHAHAYGCKQTTLLVGGPEGHLLYGLIVTFEDELLEAYGEVLEFFFNSGLNVFYSQHTDIVVCLMISSRILFSMTMLSRRNILLTTC